MRLVLVLILLSQILMGQNWLELEAKSGDTRILLLKEYNLTDQCSKDKFLSLNKIDENAFLVLGKKYLMPVKVYKYNGSSIRSTIHITDYDQAKTIEVWNAEAVAQKLKSSNYKDGGELWVPYYLVECYSEILKVDKPKHDEGVVNKSITVDLFGNKYKNVKLISNQLKGKVFYLVSGHGGPDPGAMGKCNGKDICEDEYAYDVTLRLARKITEHGGTAYMIVRDNNDGIRDQSILKCDKDEKCYPNQTIPINQIKRLDQRVAAINKLYYQHKKAGVKEQLMIVIHVDSRGTRSRVDMFFYHHKKSKEGKKTANLMYQTIKGKYAKFQKGRGYKGTVKARNLHMLRESAPAGVYIELGNIQNQQDQKRFTIVENREAMANWFLESLLK